MSRDRPPGPAEAAEGDEVPEARWTEALSRFAETHRHARVAVQIQEAGGRRRPLEPESEFELGLVGLSREEREGRPAVRVVLHKHPGATLETAEIEGARRVVQGAQSLLVEGDDGARLALRVIPPEPARS
ncbi:MAG: hypothetical protein R3263_01970 [Myxococcota bacterium]|nr:hypothetical protein [Myxococcota bacterium]